MSKVTACVPVYNGASFVQQTLDSLRSQTYQDWQCIISVDRSGDDSAAICSAFAGDPRVQLTEQPTRLGLAKNVEFLLRRAHTEYVFVLPHDDILEDRYIETLLRHMKEHLRRIHLRAHPRDTESRPRPVPGHNAMVLPVPAGEPLGYAGVARPGRAGRSRRPGRPPHSLPRHAAVPGVLSHAALPVSKCGARLPQVWQPHLRCGRASRWLARGPEPLGPRARAVLAAAAGRASKVLHGSFTRREPTTFHSCPGRRDRQPRKDQER